MNKMKNVIIFLKINVKRNILIKIKVKNKILIKITKIIKTKNI